MAKKSTSKQEQPKPTEPEAKSGPTPRRTVLTIKGTEAWADWLTRLCDHSRLPASTLVDLAVAKYAKELGFTDDPPKR